VEELYRASADFEKQMRAVPGLSDINSDLQISSPMLNVDIDREMTTLAEANISYDAMEFPLLQGQTFIDDIHKYLGGSKTFPAMTLIPAFGITPALAHSVLNGTTKAPAYVVEALKQAQAGCPGL